MIFFLICSNSDYIRYKPKSHDITCHLIDLITWHLHMELMILTWHLKIIKLTWNLIELIMEFTLVTL